MSRISRAVLALFLLVSLFHTARAQFTARGIRLDAVLDSLQDLDNRAGFLAAATDQYDSGLDLPEPPVPAGNYLQVSFGPIAGAPSWFTQFRTDWRAGTIDLTAGSVSWPILLQTDRNSGTVLLSFTLGDSLEPDVPVFVVNGSTYFNLRSSSTVSIPAAEASNLSLTLVVGTPDTPSIQFVNPSANPTFHTGESQTLTWDVAGDVAIEHTVADISLDGGSNWQVLVDSAGLVERSSWQVPTGTTDNGRLRVAVDDHLARETLAEASFRVVDETSWLTGVTITSPASGSVLEGGHVTPVSWTWEGGSENVTGAVVAFSRDGLVFTPIDTVTGTGSTASWTVPDTLFTTAAHLRVTAQVASGTAYSGEVSPLTVRPLVLLNGNFELWALHGATTGPPDNWSAPGGGYGTTWEIARSENPVDGPYCAEFHAMTPGTLTLVQEIAGPTPGYGVTLWTSFLDNAASIAGYALLECLDADGNVVASHQGNGTLDNPDYVTQSLSLTIPADAAALRVTLTVEAGAAGSVLADYIRLNYTTPPPSVTFLTPAGGDILEYDGENSVNVSWSYGATAEFVQSAVLDYRFGESGLYTELASFADGSTTSFAWTGVDTFATDCSFRITVQNGEGVSAEATSEAISITPTHREATLAGGWHLISLPLDPADRSLGAVFGDDLPNGPLVYDYTTTLGYFTPDSLLPGRGYWLALEDQQTIDVDGTASFSGYNDLLGNGWNIVGPGYPVPVQLDSLALTDGVDTLAFASAAELGWAAPHLYAYDATSRAYILAPGDTLNPFTGYWMALLDGPRTLLISPPGTAAPARASIPTPKDTPHTLAEVTDFVQTVDLRAHGALVDGVELGLMDEMSEGREAFRCFPAPPSSPDAGNPRLVVRNEGEPLPTGPWLSRDIRASLTEEHPAEEWNLVVLDGESVDVILDFSRMVDHLHPNLDAVLVVADDLWDLRQVRQVLLTTSDPRDVVVRISDRTLSVGEGSAPLPATFGITSTWPNPFNGTLHLRVALPVAGEVSVSIHDITGRCVQQWTEPGLTAGYHTLAWRTSRASGIYFIRIVHSSGERAVRKVILLK